MKEGLAESRHRVCSGQGRCLAVLYASRDSKSFEYMRIADTMESNTTDRLEERNRYI